MNGLGGRRMKVIVVDDHEVVQWGFRLILGRQPWVERCLQASNGEVALKLIAEHRPTVALVDLMLGDESGAELCEAIRRASPTTRVLLLSGVGGISDRAARAAGASGFVSKDWGTQDVVNAVRMVGLGGTVFGRDNDRSPAGLLSARERDVLERIARGETNREIAAALYLSPHTVKQHASAVYRKLRVRNRAEAVQRAQGQGLLG